MNDDGPLIIGLPAGVTVEVYPVSTEEAQEIIKQYPNMDDRFDSLIVVKGLSVQEAANYSHDIQAVIALHQAK